MNHSELVDAVVKDAASEGVYLNRNDTVQMLRSMTNVITDRLMVGDKVTVYGLGTFVTNNRGEYMGHNPRTMEPQRVKACVVPRWRASLTLKRLVNDKAKVRRHKRG